VHFSSLKYSVFAALIVITFARTPAAGQNASELRVSVRVNGVSASRRNPVMEILSASGEEMFQPGIDARIEKLTAWYHARGFFSMRVDSVCVPESDGEPLQIWIDEGPVYRFGTVRQIVNGGPAPAWLRTREDLRSGEAVSSGRMNRYFESLLNRLENSGYPLAKITLSPLAIEEKEGLLGMTLHIETGPIVHLASVRVKGNKLTRSAVVIRESRLKIGVPYSGDVIRGVRQRVQRLGIFQEVREPEVLFHKNEAHVILIVEEGNSNTADGVLGYQPAKDEQAKGVITGTLHIQMKNLLGTGRFLEAFWEKKDELSQSMRFGYEEPWMLGLPLFAGGEFQQDIRDSTYLEREWNVHIKAMPWPALSIRLGGGKKSVLPDSTGRIYYGLEELREWRLHAGLNYNTLDDPYNPSGGVEYHTLWTWGRRKPGGPENESQSGQVRHVVIDVKAVFPAFRGQVIYAGLHGEEISAGRYPGISDQIRFGGTRSVRGYREEEFRGTLVSWLNLEYRFLTARQSRFFLFLDGGYFQRREEDWIRRAVWGAGFGIRLGTRIGVLGVDYGLGQGDGILEGKVHVRLTNRF